MLEDERIIEIKDFGAGSRVFKSNSRKVSRIAKNAGISKKRAFLLNRLTSYLNIQSALELGTSVGISTAAISAGNDLELVTLEGCPETGKIAQEYFNKFGLENVHLQVGSFEEFFANSQISNSKTQNPELQTTNPEPRTPNQKFQNKNHEPQTINHTHRTTNPEQQTTNPEQRTPEPQTFDLIYFDGNHQKEATLKYFHELLPLAHNDSVFIFDDIHWSPGMEEAWEEIKTHPQVRVSIDSFFWGIVFFRKEQEKEHFILRL